MSPEVEKRRLRRSHYHCRQLLLFSPLRADEVTTKNSLYTGLDIGRCRISLPCATTPAAPTHGIYREYRRSPCIADDYYHFTRTLYFSRCGRDATLTAAYFNSKPQSGQAAIIHYAAVSRFSSMRNTATIPECHAIIFPIIEKHLMLQSFLRSAKYL